MCVCVTLFLAKVMQQKKLFRESCGKMVVWLSGKVCQLHLTLGLAPTQRGPQAFSTYCGLAITQLSLGWKILNNFFLQKRAFWGVYVRFIVSVWVQVSKIYAYTCRRHPFQVLLQSLFPMTRRKVLDHHNSFHVKKMRYIFIGCIANKKPTIMAFHGRRKDGNPLLVRLSPQRLAMMYSNFIFNLFIWQNWPPFCQIKPRNVDSFHYRKTRQNALKLLRFHFFPTEARGSLAMLFWEIEFHFLLVFTSKKREKTGSNVTYQPSN